MIEGGRDLVPAQWKRRRLGMRKGATGKWFVILA